MHLSHAMLLRKVRRKNIDAHIRRPKLEYRPLFHSSEMDTCPMPIILINLTKILKKNAKTDSP